MFNIKLKKNRSIENYYKINDDVFDINKLKTYNIIDDDYAHFIVDNQFYNIANILADEQQITFTEQVLTDLLIEQTQTIIEDDQQKLILGGFDTFFVYENDLVTDEIVVVIKLNIAIIDYSNSNLKFLYIRDTNEKAR